MRYRYLLVDNDNTLMDFNLAENLALRDTLMEAGLPADEATCQQYHHINDGLWKALERKETTLAALKVERFAQLLTVLHATSPDAQTLCDRYEANLGTHAELLPGALALLRQVKPCMKIALVSNGISAIQRGRLSRCAFTPLLDAVVISEEQGVSKPDRRMVDIALDMLGCEDPAEAVLLGDSLSADIAAARNAGIDSLWLNRHGGVSEVPTHTVVSLEEAAAWLMT